MPLGRVTSPGDGAGGKAVIRKKSEGMGCLCTWARTHTEFSAQKCFDMSSPPAPPITHLSSHLQVAIHTLMLSRLVIASSWVSFSSPPAGSQRGGLSSLPASWRRRSWHSLPSRLRQQPHVSVSAGCIDMLSIEGQFTFTADQPQLHCATFFIGEPEELITIDYDFVNIDCQQGDFLKVGSWQVLLHFPFPALI